MKKSVDEKKTLAYAVSFYFYNVTSAIFKMGSKTYEYIKTVNDHRADGRGWNTLCVCYDFKAMKYVVFVVSDEKVGNKEITIL